MAAKMQLATLYVVGTPTFSWKFMKEKYFDF